MSISDEGERLIREGFDHIETGGFVKSPGKVGTITDGQKRLINRELDRVGLEIDSNDLRMAKNELIHIYNRRINLNKHQEQKKYSKERILNALKSAFDDTARVMTNNMPGGSSNDLQVKMKKGHSNGILFPDSKRSPSIKTVFIDDD